MVQSSELSKHGRRPPRFSTCQPETPTPFAVRSTPAGLAAGSGRRVRRAALVFGRVMRRERPLLILAKELFVRLYATFHPGHDLEVLTSAEEKEITIEDQLTTVGLLQLFADIHPSVSASGVRKGVGLGRCGTPARQRRPPHIVQLLLVAGSSDARR